jgi:catecholate siderophore receptor
VNRDYYSIKQDIGTVGGEVAITPDLTLSNKTRVQRSVLDYIGTLPESANTATNTLSLNPQSRYQVTENIANQTEATYKFGLAGWKHTALGGVEVSREIASIDKYVGLSSEALTGGAATGSITGASTYAPQYTFANVGGNPTWSGFPTKIAIDTKSFYLLDTANYNDLVILNGGVRYDHYDIKASGFGTVNSVATVFNAQHQQYGLPTRRRRIRSAPNSTAPARSMADWRHR